MLLSQEIDLTIDQWTLIKSINDHEQLSQVQLSKLTAKDPASIKRILDLLGEKGYIERKKSESNQRIHELSLTEKGSDVVHKMFPIIIDFEAKGMENIGHEEMNTLNVVLEKLMDNFDC